MKNKYIPIFALALAVSLLVFSVVFAKTRSEGKSSAVSDAAEMTTETEAESLNRTEAAETEDTAMLETESEASEETETESHAGEQISVAKPQTSRISATEISISWEAPEAADEVSRYIVKRCARVNGADAGDWESVAEVSADAELSVTDKLASSDPQQFSYRVDAELKSDSVYAAAAGESVLASNIMICIDPGHYAAGEAVTGEDTYDYVEGVFTLKIGLSLKRILKDKYGIDSYLTRDSGVITLGGYSDEALDKAHIALRGEYAGKKGSTLFISLHTNSNQDDANGYTTYHQPESITKTLVIINKTGMLSQRTIDIANEIGTRLTAANIALGIASTGFDTVDAGSIIEWTSPYNDALGLNGTVCKRYKSNGDDFYGVLRGATSVNVPGILVEHGYHSVVSMRILAAEGSLADTWAEIDADGIAAGFGFGQ